MPSLVLSPSCFIRICTLQPLFMLVPSLQTIGTVDVKVNSCSGPFSESTKLVGLTLSNVKKLSDVFVYEIVEIIKQVRQCLEITRQQRVRETSPLECKFQVHRKIKLKSFSFKGTRSNKELTKTPTTQNNKPRKKDGGSSSDPIKFQDAAGRGDIKEILQILN